MLPSPQKAGARESIHVPRGGGAAKGAGGERWPCSDAVGYGSPVVLRVDTITERDAKRGLWAAGGRAGLGRHRLPRLGLVRLLRQGKQALRRLRDGLAVALGEESRALALALARALLAPVRKQQERGPGSGSVGELAQRGRGSRGLVVDVVAARIVFGRISGPVSSCRSPQLTLKCSDRRDRVTFGVKSGSDHRARRTHM